MQMKKKEHLIYIKFLLVITSIAIISCESILDFSTEDISNEFIKSIPAGSKIAVVDVNTNDTTKKVFTENLITDLIRNSDSKFSVIERNLVQDALKEMKMQSTDLFDRKEIVELGKFLGANFIITGTLYRGSHLNFDFKYILNMRCINIKTLEIISAIRFEKSHFLKSEESFIIIFCSLLFLIVIANFIRFLIEENRNNKRLK
jgi:TolB-like protein